MNVGCGWGALRGHIRRLRSPTRASAISLRAVVGERAVSGFSDGPEITAEGFYSFIFIFQLYFLFFFPSFRFSHHTINVIFII